MADRSEIPGEAKPVTRVGLIVAVMLTAAMLMPLFAIVLRLS